MAMSLLPAITSLPLEVLEEIWSNLNFHTCQRICTQVSKSWFFGIRNSPKLSSELRIKKRIREFADEDVNSFLSNWTKLRILETDEKESKVKSDILSKKIKKYEDLDKIICIPNSDLNEQLGLNFRVEKIWINPKEVASDGAPFKLENIVCLSNARTWIGKNWNDKINEFGTMMTGLEELQILGHDDYFLPDNEWMSTLSSLESWKTLTICTRVGYPPAFKDLNVTSQLERLKKLKKLKISYRYCT